MRFVVVWRRLGAATVGVVLGVAASGSPALAEMYRWTDEAGVPHYAEGIDSVPERHRGRAVPLKLQNMPAAPASAAAPAGGSRASATTVRFTPGERILVDARINGGTSARLLLDTGADRTLIAPRTLVAAGVSLVRPAATGQIIGVTGTTEALGVRIASLEVGEARVGPMLVISHDMSQEGIDGLLGRDFLGQFNVTIDSASGLLTIAPK